MQLHTLLPAVWILVGLTEAEFGVPDGLRYAEPAGNGLGNFTTLQATAEGAKTNIIVAVFFIGLVTILMGISLYCTLNRKGCGQYRWKKQMDEESLS